MVAAHTFAPPSGNHRRATEVSTQCFKPILATASATRGGSAKVKLSGFTSLHCTKSSRHEYRYFLRSLMWLFLSTSIPPYWGIEHFGKQYAIGYHQQYHELFHIQDRMEA